jgi:hypothetical protein
MKIKITFYISIILTSCLNKPSDKEMPKKTINSVDSNSLLKKQNSNKKSPINKPIIDSLVKKNNSLDDYVELKKKYNYVRATYHSFSFGDIPHYIFKTESKTFIEFYGNKDRAVRLEIQSNSIDAEQGLAINKKMKGKTFDIFYKNEKYEVPGWDPENALDGLVIYKLFESKK